MSQFCANSSPLCFGTILASSKSHLFPISSRTTSGQSTRWVGGQRKKPMHITQPKLIIYHSQKNISELLDAKSRCTYQQKCLVTMLNNGYQLKLPQNWHHHSNITSKQSHTLTSTISRRYFVMLSNEFTFVMSYTIIIPWDRSIFIRWR